MTMTMTLGVCVCVCVFALRSCLLCSVGFHTCVGVTGGRSSRMGIRVLHTYSQSQKFSFKMKCEIEASFWAESPKAECE